MRGESPSSSLTFGKEIQLGIEEIVIGPSPFTKSNTTC